MLQELVALPSISSPDARFDQSNRAVIESLAAWAESLGFRVEVQSLPSQPEKANLIATLGEGEGGLLLSGHSDTVPYDEEAWTSDPFQVTERQGRLYGLGTADMKGFFAAALEAARAFDAGRLRRPLYLVATADEESSFAGVKALEAAGKPSARYAVIGEPTGLVPVRMHKGIMMERLALRGRAGHSSDPSLGASALDAMMRALQALDEYRRELAETSSDARFEVAAPTLNFGKVVGGDSPNRICASCSLDFDVRLVPSLSIESVRGSLRARVEAALEGMDVSSELVPLFAGVPAFETPSDASIVKAVEELTGSTARAVMFATEAPFFGRMGIETLVCGAGDIAVAHQADEYTTRSGIEAATALYAKLIHHFCVETA